MHRGRIGWSFHNNSHHKARCRAIQSGVVDIYDSIRLDNTWRVSTHLRIYNLPRLLARQFTLEKKILFTAAHRNVAHGICLHSTLSNSSRFPVRIWQQTSNKGEMGKIRGCLAFLCSIPRRELDNPPELRQNIYSYVISPQLNISLVIFWSKQVFGLFCAGENLWWSAMIYGGNFRAWYFFYYWFFFVKVWTKWSAANYVLSIYQKCLCFESH